jgi:hypothetical protein
LETNIKKLLVGLDSVMLLDLSNPKPPPNLKLLLPPKEKTPNIEETAFLYEIYKKTSIAQVF